MRLIPLLLLAGATSLAQDPVTIRVDAAKSSGPLKPIYAFFGHDEPNYTYMKDGRKLLSELSSLSPTTVYMRVHSLLVTGDGKAALKWGSTNAYTEDASGTPVYDWTVTDRIFDTYLERKMKPLVQIGFMPEALSSRPQPYRHYWKPGDNYNDIYTGWAYPPKDYAKWAELVYQWVRHCVQKYGRPEVESWLWEVWNEPNIGYWKGTPEEYHKLYDYSADAVKRALPAARIGGPDSTGPASNSAGAFLRNFLDHAVHGKNYVTGKAGAPLDFVSFHAKGSPKFVEGNVVMGIENQLRDLARGFEIVASVPELKGRPIVIGESDPEGCAACSSRVYPQNAYRNGTLYPAYTAVMMKNIFDSAARRGANIAGMLTWAFEFEEQPYFDGFRTLASNGIDKPVLNLFRMAGLMQGNRVKVESDSGVDVDAVIKDGVHGKPDVDALAARSDHGITVLLWNYHDDDVPAPDSDVQLRIAGVPASARRVLTRHYRIDQTHSNAYTTWKHLGLLQHPTPEQYAALEAAGRLQLLDSSQWTEARAGEVRLAFPLPRQAVSLVELSW